VLENQLYAYGKIFDLATYDDKAEQHAWYSDYNVGCTTKKLV
jgi:hypothetical protein